MLELFRALRGLDFASLLVRLLTTFLCGMVIGLERSAKNRPAGIRTHILVCLSGAVAAITGQYLVLGLHLPADITRISGQIITGLGFIGMGTIIVTKKMTIKGLTTAAGLWTTGIIGLAIGSGFYEGGILGTILVLITETFLSRFGIQIRQRPEVIIELLYRNKNSLDAVLRCCKDRRMLIRNLQIRMDSASESGYRADITLFTDRDIDAFLDSVRTMSGIQSASVKWSKESPDLQ